MEDVAALSDGAEPVALFLDIDGTLLDLAARPYDVVMPADLVPTLASAERKLGGALALVSGRPVDEVDCLFKPLRLRASGVHGAEIRLDPAGPTSLALSTAELPRTLLAALTQTAKSFPGVLVEDKRFSFAVHYRLAPAAERPLREAIMRLVDSTSVAVEILDAHYAIEIKAPGCDKGRAIAAFLTAPPFRGRTPVFVGDDTTDESGFAVVAARGGYPYSVGRRRPGAIGVFSEPRAVRDWLADFVARGDRQ
jgi:trehalose 6-phosphate phosphatase